MFGTPIRQGLVVATLLLALTTVLAFSHPGPAQPATATATATTATATTAITPAPMPMPATAAFYNNLDDLQLLDQDGRAFRPAALAGKLVLMNFVFTGCSTSCPTQTRELAALQQSLPASLRRDVHFVSISVDPLGDTPARLRAYGAGAGADFSDWTFATGRPQDIERLGERLRLFRGGAPAGRPEDHATGLWLVDGNGRLMQRYGGTGADMTRLARELGQLRDLGTRSG